jgi:uncharacterized protein YndB with AHSA1/START domain
MAKTGESYTAARRHAVKPKEELNEDQLPQSDAAVRKNTGKGWKEWLRILDAWGAKEHKHGEIATYLIEEQGVPGWWAQTITGGYERSRGMRVKYQTMQGSFSVSVSKTLPVGVGKLYKAFTDARQRSSWLERGTLKSRTSQRNKSARFDFRDGSSRVQVYFESKERAKTTVTVMHERLADVGAVEEMRAMWKDRLADLARMVDRDRSGD